LRRRGVVAAGEKQSADELKSKVNISSFICTEASNLRGDVPSESRGLRSSSAAHTHVLAVVAPTVLAAHSLGVASGVGTPLSICAHVLDRGAQAGAETTACGDATLPQQEKNTWQTSIRTE
jgi:hypothetical protein